MFELTKNCRMDKNLVSLILQILSLLSKNIEKYFSSLDASSLDWVRDPFVLSACESAVLIVAEEGGLTEIRNHRGLKLKHLSTDMTSFWLSLQEEYRIIIKKAIEVLLPFSTSYLCEAGFSAMNTMKSKTRSRLQTLEEGPRVCLSTIQSRTRNVMRQHQAQVSHLYFYVREGFLVLLTFVFEYNLYLKVSYYFLMNGSFSNDILFQCINKKYVQNFQTLLKTMINNILLEIKYFFFNPWTHSYHFYSFK